MLYHMPVHPYNTNSYTSVWSTWFTIHSAQLITKIRMIIELVKDVRQLYSACYPKSFRLIFQTRLQYGPAWPFYSAYRHKLFRLNFQNDPQYDPAWLTSSISSLPHQSIFHAAPAKKNPQKNASGFLLITPSP